MCTHDCMCLRVSLTRNVSHSRGPSCQYSTLSISHRRPVPSVTLSQHQPQTTPSHQSSFSSNCSWPSYQSSTGSINHKRFAHTRTHRRTHPYTRTRTNIRTHTRTHTYTRSTVHTQHTHAQHVHTQPYTHTACTRTAGMWSSVIDGASG
jgi:hypothetical protein